MLGFYNSSSGHIGLTVNGIQDLCIQECLPAQQCPRCKSRHTQYTWEQSSLLDLCFDTTPSAFFRRQDDCIFAVKTIIFSRQSAVFFAVRTIVFLSWKQSYFRENRRWTVLSVTKRPPSLAWLAHSPSNSWSLPMPSMHTVLSIQEMTSEERERTSQTKLFSKVVLSKISAFEVKCYPI